MASVTDDTTMDRSTLIVSVIYHGGDKGSLGPFRFLDEAEQCVLNLSQLENVRSAEIGSYTPD